MKLTYLGTAAYEGVPAAFCECPVCTAARREGGRNVRGRASSLIERDLLIDIAPDLSYSAGRAGIGLSRVLYILITHSHSDHFAFEELRARDTRWYCTIPNAQPVTVVGNRRVGELLRAHCDLADTDMTFREIRAFESVALGAYRVTALPAAHKPDEDAFFYLIERGGRTLLYAHDTGMPDDAVFAYLAGKRLDCISLDCTCALTDTRATHMGVAADIEVRERLRQLGCVDARTICVCNHFSHNGLHRDGDVMLHEEFAQFVQKEGFLASYDSMEIEI